MNREFFKFVIPSMIAFSFSGIYSIVDGWFVGNYLNETGLAAINVAYPITAFILATGTALGMGGSIFISISRGKDQLEEQRTYLGITLALLLAAGIMEMVLMYAVFPTVLRFFGAYGELFTLGEEYIRWIIFGTLFQVIGSGLVPVVRNYDGAHIAMISMITGFMVNVVLDWVFIAVFGWGMMGAALATVLGQGCSIVPSLIFLIKKKKLTGYARFRLDGKKIREILAVAVSPFGLTFAGSVVMIIINKNAIIHGGERAAACYAVISYVTYIVQMLIQGIGDGSQPLISRYFGAGRKDMVKKLRNMAFVTAEVTAAASVILLIAGSETVSLFFGMSGQGVSDVKDTMPYFAAGIVFMAIERIMTSVFYAMDRNGYAYVLIYGELISMGILATVVLPPFMGVTGVWLSVPVAQVAMAALSVPLLRKSVENADSVEKMAFR